MDKKYIIKSLLSSYGIVVVERRDDLYFVIESNTTQYPKGSKLNIPNAELMDLSYGLSLINFKIGETITFINDLKNKFNVQEEALIFKK